MELIEDKALLKLNINILAIGYLDKGASFFIEVTGNNEKTIEDSREAEMVSNSKEKTKKKGFT